MSGVSVLRPKPDEAAPFYHGYIAKVGDEDLGTQLQRQLDQVEQLFDNLTDAAGLARYAEGKWSIKEVLGHLIDTERIFGYRLLRIARGDVTPLSGFDEKSYVPEGQFDQRPLPMLLVEFRAVRSGTLALMEGLPEESWSRLGTANGTRVSARALAYIIAGHAAHHLATLRERYGLGGGAGLRQV